MKSRFSDRNVVICGRSPHHLHLAELCVAVVGAGSFGGRKWKGVTWVGSTHQKQTSLAEARVDFDSRRCARTSAPPPHLECAGRHRCWSRGPWVQTAQCPGWGGGGMPDSSGTRSKVLGVIREVRSCRGNFPEASSYLYQEIGRRQGGVSNSPGQLCDVGGQGTGGGKAGQRGGAAWATEHRGSHRRHRQKVRTC